MRFCTAAICLAAFVMTGMSPVWAQDNNPQNNDSLSEYQDPGMKLPDPVADNGTHFAPAIATAGTADAGPTLDAVRTDTKGCSALNPCAAHNPTLENALPRRQASGAKTNSSS
jgi:hypothetical protein